MFHQIEGLMVDENVTLADLKTVLKLFATSYLGNEVPIRIRPSFFPFTEPSVEADYFWDGKWVEFGGAGIVDPNVLRSVGYDPEQVSGFAFGLGSRTAVHDSSPNHGYSLSVHQRRPIPEAILTFCLTE